MEGLSEERKRKVYDELMAYDIPCVVFSRQLQPDSIFLEIAHKYNRPVPFHGKENL